ncbi:MAG: damage-inducible protein, partial [Thiotrichales bacterium]
MINNSDPIDLTNAGFIEANTADGLRKCLVDEFSSLYIFHLRGNQRTSGELSRKEGGKIFGSGSRAPIAISLLVRNPDAKQQGQIFFHDIGDYLTREQKLEKVSAFKSVSGIAKSNGWNQVTPDEYGDWLNQRDHSFGEFILLSSKKSEVDRIFCDYSNGVKTNRDAWCYNYSSESLSGNINDMLVVYNSELEAIYNNSNYSVTQDSTRISWSSGLLNNVDRKLVGSFSPIGIRRCLYRPFTRSWAYFDSFLNDRPGQMPKIFPPDKKNIIIWTTGVGATLPFSSWISDTICSIQQGPAAAQHFPLYIYEKVDEASAGKNDLFAEQVTPDENGYTRKDGISDAGLAHFHVVYPDEAINKEDLFYYIYGLLHSEEYRSRYADNLSKELPRIPAVKTAKDFWAFSKAGRQLAELHLNYETVEMYPVKVEGGAVGDDCRVEKMKHPKIKVDGKS